MPTGLVVKSQASRSREQNRRAARRLLAERLDELRNGRPGEEDASSRTALVAAVKNRRRASADKKSRRKYRLLAAEGEAAEAAEAAAGGADGGAENLEVPEAEEGTVADEVESGEPAGLSGEAAIDKSVGERSGHRKGDTEGL